MVDNQQAQAFLTNQLALNPTEVALIGEGAWSRCFGFRQGDEELVIRFGNYVEDFEKDQRAHAYAGPDLPIPAVLDMGEAFGGYYAISTRAYGMPLESVDAAQWHALVPAVAAALEAMRMADLSATSGFGGWGADGQASEASWSSRLLRVNEDDPNQRTHGWRARLATLPAGEEAFTWGYDLLQQVATDDVPRCLLHCDLINRNVLVQGERITGIFDWGCSVYGDHLYELAWFDFWGPWTPQLNMHLLRTELERRWAVTGYVPHDIDARLMACYLHIGLDHLAYNAYLGDWPSLLATAKQMKSLVESIFT